METSSQHLYKTPPQDVVNILDAPLTPVAVMSPMKDKILFVEYTPYPPISLVAQPFLKLGGVRINPGLNARQRLTQYTSLKIKNINSGREIIINVPKDSSIFSPAWSPDGSKIAFSRDGENGVELWIANAETGKASRLSSIFLNDILTSPITWMRDNLHIIANAIPQKRSKAPQQNPIPLGPVIEETKGKFSKMMTYQDLLKSPHDEALFEYYTTSQLLKINTDNGKSTEIGSAQIHTSFSLSPDQQNILKTVLKRPFSYRVPYSYFSRETVVTDLSGKLLKTIADLPISDEIPTHGVPSGPRSVQWQPLHKAKLIWAEALDEGDPLKKVPYRDKVMTLDIYKKENSPREILKVEHRFAGFEWGAGQDEILLHEYDRDRRWIRSTFINITQPAAFKNVLVDISVNDEYNDPGNPLYERNATGDNVIAQDGDWAFFTGQGASEAGYRPFLDKINVRTGEKIRLYQAAEGTHETVVSFKKGSRTDIITRYETRLNPPNYFTVRLDTREREALTKFKDPAPQLTTMRKEIIRYTRADGTPLSGTLFLPPNYKEGDRLPLVMWAYPQEFSDAGTAGQVRSSPNSFVRLTGTSPLFFATQGYAVLSDAAMPVVGDPETMNNTFIEQIVSSAKAAIDKLDEMGIIDRGRVVVGGHSYGAFMTANLLAHSDLFAAGIARSGAYNRTLTPFGFQSERRSYWEAMEIYHNLSPFNYANKINEPLLIIHGDADNNPGTHTMQSERLFQAIRGTGGTARLVLLPYESHGYQARESVLHVLYEMFEWADKYVKNREVDEKK
ncbi:MAG TPA: prolyl oligopeptidase family serine peptidase [Patescibacteria group bacterium]|nr:prolyl oligopeptidase family serine peptidase [Patescibacteria group bacterium]